MCHRGLTSLRYSSPIKLIPKCSLTMRPLPHCLIKRDISTRVISEISKSKKEGPSMINSTNRTALILLLSGVSFFSVGLCSADESSFTKTISAKILDTIENSTEIPGIKSEEFTSIKPELTKTWNTLLEKGVVEITGTDKEIRPHFVALQGIIEHILASELDNEVTSFHAVIHTPMPATPLCTKGEISKNLVDPKVEGDPKQLWAVKARPVIIRECLARGANYVIAYPAVGMSKRTEEQQSIYKQELVNYPDSLVDAPLNCDSIPSNLIGASIAFENKSGEKFFFNINITQANDPKELATFSLHFGSIDNPAIKERRALLDGFFKPYGLNIP